MRWLPGLAVGTGFVAACTADRTATEPDGIERVSAERALAANAWTLRAAQPGGALWGRSTTPTTRRPNRWRILASSQFGHDALLKVQLNGRAHLLAVGGNHGPHIDIANPSELYTP